jgi:hypothetical protein
LSLHLNPSQMIPIQTIEMLRKKFPHRKPVAIFGLVLVLGFDCFDLAMCVLFCLVLALWIFVDRSLIPLSTH